MQRDTYFDSIKFFTIFTVILAHVLEKYINTSQSLGVLYSFIYMFHMPLFVFISGYFYKDFSFAKLKKWVINILQILLVYQIIMCLPSLKNLKISMLYEPVWVLWFLLSLISWKIIVYFVHSWNKKIVIIGSIILSVLVGFIPFIGFPLSLSRTFVFLPFFVLGCFTTPSIIEKIKSYNKIIPILIILCAVLFAIYINPFHDITNRVLWGSRAYSLISDNIPTLALLRIVFQIIAFCLIFAVLNIFSSISSISFFLKYGSRTLQLYLFQGVIIYYFFILNYKFNLSFTTPVLFIIAILLTIFICIFTNFKISNILVNPIGYFINRKTN